MDLVLLREKQIDFLANKETWLKNVYLTEEKRKKFVEKFSLEKLKNMTVDEYIVGKGSHDSFCYWLETELIELGSIKGGTTAPNKFGVYFGITSSEAERKYRHLPKWGNSPEEAFENIKSEIISLVSDGALDDSDLIINNKVAPMFKGKILATYYPEKYLSVFSEDHLDYFLNLFNVRFNHKANPVHKRDLLKIIKSEDEIFFKMSPVEFSFFLYKSFHPPKRQEPGTEIKVANEVVVEGLLDFKQDNFPLYEDLKFEFVDLNSGNSNDDQERSARKVKLKYKVDYELRSSKCRMRGERGEFYVLEQEKEFLIKNNKGDLALKVTQVSKDDDSLGYDILSFDLDGKEKYIEVKSTVSRPDNVQFYLTNNELIKSRSLTNYYLYIVFEITSTNPKIAKILSPFSDNNKFELNPILYSVNLK
jgi:hypothetical protein